MSDRPVQRPTHNESEHRWWIALPPSGHWIVVNEPGARGAVAQGWEVRELVDRGVLALAVKQIEDPRPGPADGEMSDAEVWAEQEEWEQRFEGRMAVIRKALGDAE